MGQRCIESVRLIGPVTNEPVREVICETGVGRVRLIPDAFLDFRFADKRLPLYLEHDRSSEQELHFRRRIRVYIEWVKSGVYRERFGASVVTVAFTTFAGDRRLQQMRS